MIVLGIETSCDETSVAVIEDNRVLSNIISSQMIHEKFGGVVPELASREHIRLITVVMRQAIEQSGVNLSQIEGIAVTAGPGLIGAVLVGLNFAKGLAISLRIPFVGVNHMEGHIYANFLTDPDLTPPLLAIVVSGGHTQLVHMEGHLKYHILGSTRDDAVGEAFDKAAKILNLGYPGGPQIDELAKKGNPDKIVFPQGRIKDHPYDFSYSGLKTSVMTYVGKKSSEELEAARNDICAGFQKAAIMAIVKRAQKAMKEFGLKTVVLAGGVAANTLLREKILSLGRENGWHVGVPDMAYCMDNAAMIARAGLQRLQSGYQSPLTQKAYSAMPLHNDITELESDAALR